MVIFSHSRADHYFLRPRYNSQIIPKSFLQERPTLLSQNVKCKLALFGGAEANQSKSYFP